VEAELRVWVDEVADLAVVVHVAGEVDMLTAPTVEEHLSAVCARVNPPRRVVVDLRRVEFFGNAGLALLVIAREQCRKRKVVLGVLAINRAVLRPLRLTGLDGSLNVVSTLEAAMPSPEATAG
jgi:anti-anti-sigma factor